MVINFNQDTHTLWHSDCDRDHSPPMKEIRKEGDGMLLECTHCAKRGIYPIGGTGRINIAEVN